MCVKVMCAVYIKFLGVHVHLLKYTLCLVYIDPLSLLSMSFYCSNISHYQSQNTFTPVYPQGLASPLYNIPHSSSVSPSMCT